MAVAINSEVPNTAFFEVIIALAQTTVSAIFVAHVEFPLPKVRCTRARRRPPAVRGTVSRVKGVCPTRYGAGVPTERMKASANTSHMVSMSGMGSAAAFCATGRMNR